MSEVLLDYEDLVLEFIHEYLDKNRNFNSKKIIPFLNSRFAKSSININVNGIKAILSRLVGKNIIVEGSKLIKDDVLLNTNRNDIYDFILHNPGIYFNKIVNELKLSIPVVEWHLNILKKFDFIRIEKINSHEAYFDIKVKSQDKLIIHLLSREKCKQIVDYLKLNNEGISKYQLSEELGMHPNTITKYVNKLFELGLLSKKALSNKTLYFLNIDFYNELKKKFY